MKIFLSGSGLPVSAALLVPGVSPMRSTLATETGANNPGLRLYKYDVGSGQVGLLTSPKQIITTLLRSWTTTSSTST